MTDVPGGGGIGAANVPWVQVSETAGTAERRTAIRQGMPISVRADKLQAIGEPLFQFGRHAVVVAKAEARCTLNAADPRKGAVVGLVAQGIARDTGVCRVEVV